MRLICPKCNAQYEIDRTMIPEEGREVECSACGHVWLQAPLAEPKEEPPAIQPAAVATQEPARIRSATPRGLSGDLLAAAKGRQTEAPDLGDAPILQRPLPDDVLSILREETARELGARKQAKVGATNDEPAAAKPAHVTEEKSVASDEAAPNPGKEVAADPSPDWPATTVTQPDPVSTTKKHKEPESVAPAFSHDVSDTEPVERVSAESEAPASPVVTPVAAASANVATPETKPAAGTSLPRRRVTPGLPDAEKLAGTIQTAQLAPPPIVQEREREATAPQPPSRSGYRSGLIRGLSVAAALLLAYVAGAGWVQTGQAPDAVVSLIGGVDNARAGLRDAVDSVLGQGGQ
ncbi:zinc-ribbon domain-containing protein [Paracoccus albus]|uniref:zinc-ribbon domain-containing protein n=1 Tax=Paracoccus albus TaxID=3017784 RepID=UPI0022F0CEF6|nr:zinc-ribbon domain-containing protein [Paracoccus albus]WBU60452.1 zinc-ribbon domain-containing protein [Paracoccus albus]